MKNKAGIPTVDELFGFNNVPEENIGGQESKFPWTTVIICAVLIGSCVVVVYHQNKNHKFLRTEIADIKNKFAEKKMDTQEQPIK
jgi:hypothetical protein